MMALDRNEICSSGARAAAKAGKVVSLPKLIGVMFAVMFATIGQSVGLVHSGKSGSLHDERDCGACVLAHRTLDEDGADGGHDDRGSDDHPTIVFYHALFASVHSVLASQHGVAFGLAKDIALIAIDDIALPENRGPPSTL